MGTRWRRHVQRGNGSEMPAAEGEGQNARVQVRAAARPETEGEAAAPREMPALEHAARSTKPHRASARAHTCARPHESATDPNMRTHLLRTGSIRRASQRAAGASEAAREEICLHPTQTRLACGANSRGTRSSSWTALCTPASLASAGRHGSSPCRLAACRGSRPAGPTCRDLA